MMIEDKAARRLYLHRKNESVGLTAAERKEYSSLRRCVVNFIRKTWPDQWREVVKASLGRIKFR